MTFNPSAPTALGLEWFIENRETVIVDAATECVAQTHPSTVSETIDTVHAALDNITGGSGVYALEVYDIDDVVFSGQSLDTKAPTSDASTTNAKNQAGGTSNLFQSVDETPSSFADYIANQATGAGEWSGRPSISAGDYAGRRVYQVQLVVDYQSTNLSGAPTLRPFLNIGGVKYTNGSLPFELAQRNAAFTWTTNPSTGLPWTSAEIEALGSTDEIGFELNGNPQAGTSRVGRLVLLVHHVAENRVAVGGRELDLADVGAWVAFDVLAPDGSGWAKTSGAEYLFVIRRLSGTSALSVLHLVGFGLCPHGMLGAIPTMASSGLITSLPAAGDARRRVFGLVLEDNASAISVDSQPYTTTLVHDATAQVSGEFTGAAEDYGAVRLVVHVQPSPPPDPLTVEIRRRSDNALMATAVVTLADLESPPDAVQIVTVPLDAAVTLAAVQYAFVPSSPLAGWDLFILRGEDGLGASVGFGGTTNRAGVFGVESDDYDLMATIVVSPDPLTNLRLSMTADDVPGVLVEWDGTTPNFQRAELQRLGDDGEWRLVHSADDEADQEFTDFEIPRGGPVSYRVRWVRFDDVPSQWTDVESITPSADDCLWYFTSNVDPSHNQAWMAETPQVFEFPESTVEAPMHGRDFAVVFREIERRGDRFPLNLFLDTDARPLDVDGRRAFDPVIEIARDDDLPYVHVADPFGNVWMASLFTPTGEHREPNQQYRMPVIVRQTTSTPYPV